jgi:hypothetical protein
LPDSGAVLNTEHTAQKGYRIRGAGIAVDENGLKDRQISPEHIDDLVYGRRSAWDYPKKKPKF